MKNLFLMFLVVLLGAGCVGTQLNEKISIKLEQGRINYIKSPLGSRAQSDFPPQEVRGRYVYFRDWSGTTYTHDQGTSEYYDRSWSPYNGLIETYDRREWDDTHIRTQEIPDNFFFGTYPDPKGPQSGYWEWP